jgi:hypothetical protein
MIANDLAKSRNKVLAKSFYKHLKGEGLTSEQIIELSTQLLDMVTDDIRTPHTAPPRVHSPS